MKKDTTIYVCEDCDYYLLLDDIEVGVAFAGDQESPPETFEYCPSCHGQNDFPPADVEQILRILNNEYLPDGTQ